MKKIIALMTLLHILSSCSTKNDLPITDHFDGKRFYNLDGPSSKSFFDVFKWKITSTTESWENYPETEVKKVIPEKRITAGYKVTFLTHASFLIQTKGLNIITDPVWSKRASPFSFLGPVAARVPAVDFENLPPIDIVIVSHNHYDHMDKETLKRLSQIHSPLFIVPLENAKLLKSFGIEKNVIELDWWDTHQFNEDLKITHTPARHWSRRTLLDTNQYLWGSFFFETNESKIYFAADTGYGIHFKMIHERLGAPDIALLPIGAYAPRWFMKEAHMDPADALMAHQDLQSKLSVGMHFGTFQLTDEGPLEPVTLLEKEKIKMGITNFIAPYPGQDFNQ